MAITTKKGQPITGSRTAMQSRSPVLANQAQTSRDAQKIVNRPPMPFDNPRGTVKAPAPSNRSGSWRVDNLQGSSGKRAGVGNTYLSAQEMNAVGYAPTATRSTNPIISGFPTRNNPRKSGGASQSVANWGKQPSTAATRRAIPAADTGAVRGDNRGMRNYEDPKGNRFANGPMSMDGVRKGSHFRGASLTQRPARKKGEAPFYGQR